MLFGMSLEQIGIDSLILDIHTLPFCTGKNAENMMVS